MYDRVSVGSTLLDLGKAVSDTMFRFVVKKLRVFYALFEQVKFGFCAERLVGSDLQPKRRLREQDMRADKVNVRLNLIPF